ncbi:hypothetical protein [Brucella intermedia]|uniref:hypothetical protein n=1 Tax=Brucella intermedia TaxID=94625 RepID=UPI00224ABD29|nr:hypothetical protein [Brucella intermedia]
MIENLLALPWLSPIGILINTLGVCMLAFEWRTSMYDSLNRLEIEQSDLIAKSGGSPKFNGYTDISPKAKKLLENIDPDTVTDEQLDSIMILDSVHRLNRRMWIFRLGFCAVIIGAALQVIAAWPQ